MEWSPAYATWRPTVLDSDKTATADEIALCPKDLRQALELVRERNRYRKTLLAVRQLIEPSNPCHEEIHAVLLDTFGSGEVPDA